jgi:kynurenine formamidase
VLIDLSHRVVAGMTTYPGLPGPEITDHLTRAETAQRMAPGVSFQIGRICMVANTGTYVDMPFHFYEDGDDLSGVTLDRIAQLDAAVVDHHDARPPWVPSSNPAPRCSTAVTTLCCAILHHALVASSSCAT